MSDCVHWTDCKRQHTLTDAAAGGSHGTLCRDGGQIKIIIPVGFKVNHDWTKVSCSVNR